MSIPAVQDHVDLCSFLVLDAVNPLKTLSFLRHKIMQVHTTNVYDNLPDEEVVRRDGKLYFVQVRAWCGSRPSSRFQRTNFAPQ
jgi:hypothetical protein